MAVVDFDLRFTYVLAGWEGSTHDAIILADALQRQNGIVIEREIRSNLFLYEFWWLNCPTQIIGLTSLL
jgi:hypothetical protein